MHSVKDQAGVIEVHEWHAFRALDERRAARRPEDVGGSRVMQRIAKLGRKRAIAISQSVHEACEQIWTRITPADRTPHAPGLLKAANHQRMAGRETHDCDIDQ